MQINCTQLNSMDILWLHISGVSRIPKRPVGILADTLADNFVQSAFNILILIYSCLLTILYQPFHLL